MQCPPTRPGRNGRKFHLVPAASSTSSVSMPSRSKMIASSFISAMLRSRWVFSMTLAASATLMLEARCTPAVTMLLVHRRDSLEGLRRVAGHHLDDLRERAFLVAGIDALGRVADEEVLLPFHARMLLQDRDADLLGGAGVDGRFEHDRRAALQVPADRLGRARPAARNRAGAPRRPASAPRR